jgi:hypothetical protein
MQGLAGLVHLQERGLHYSYDPNPRQRPGRKGLYLRGGAVDICLAMPGD